jgi:hypothetical protein
MKKAQYADDIFTTEMEARGRSMDLGLNGEIHVSDYDGQVVYMPANSHEAYLDFYAGLAGLPTEDDTEEDMGESPAYSHDAPVDRNSIPEQASPHPRWKQKVRSFRPRR